MPNNQKQTKKRRDPQTIQVNDNEGASVSSDNVLDLRSIVAQQETQKMQAERARQKEQLELQATTEKGSRKSRAGTEQEDALMVQPVRGLRRFFLRKQHDVSGVHTETRTQLNTSPPQTSPHTTEEVRLVAPNGRPVAEAFWGELYKDEPMIAAHEEKKHSVIFEEDLPPVMVVVSPESEADVPTPLISAKPPKPVKKKKAKEKKVVTDRRRAWSAYWKRPLESKEVEKAKRAKTLPEFGFSFGAIGRPLIGFIVIALVVVIPISVSATLSGAQSLEATVTENAETAFGHIQSAGASLQSFDFGSAERAFTDAQAAFQVAQQEIGSINGLALAAAKLVPVKGELFNTGQRLLIAGEELAAAGQQVSKALQVLNGLDVQQVATNEDQQLTDVLVVLHSALVPTVEHIAEANKQLGEIDLTVVPQDKREFAQLAQETLPAVESQLRDAEQMSETLLAILGHEKKKRYLVLFQNNHEIRPTGGFIGSLALIDIEGGNVSGLDIPGGGVYDVSGQLAGSVQPPAPLQLVNNEWNLQDANWFFHFPSSAQKALWFYERSGGPTVDGVITLVPRVIEQLLEVSGPIDMTEEFDVVIDAENFYEEVQVRAEEKFDETQESKKIIGALTPLLFDQLFDAASDPQSLLELLATMQHALNSKDMLLYMSDPQIQRALSEQDWAGEVKQTDRDYLAVVHTNIGGGKTDGVVDNTITHNAKIASDGSIEDTVTLTRSHKGASDDPLQGVNNVDFVRFYVPQGATLVSVEGFETPDPKLFFAPLNDAQIDEDLNEISGEMLLNSQTGVYTNDEFQKSVFGGWMQTPVGESSTVTITYRLPFKIDVMSLWNQTDRYSLLWQKQPGSWPTYTESSMSLPENMRISRLYPPDYTGTIAMVLEEDLFAGMVIERNRE